MRIVSLIENNCNNENLIREHGLSLYIEFEHKKILFDTGFSGDFIKNAEKLKINLKDIDYVIISHGHSDHCGGLKEFFKINNKGIVFLKSSAIKDYYSESSGKAKYIGIDKELLKTYTNRFKFIDNDTEIFKNGYIITNLLYKKDFKNEKTSLKKLEEKALVNDDFQHELIFVAKEENNLIIFTGCSHNGILNMIKTIMNKFKNCNIKSVIGGFHLVAFPDLNKLNCSENQLETLGLSLLNLNIPKIYTCHCTGLKAYNLLKNILKDKLEYLDTGKEIIL